MIKFTLTTIILLVILYLPGFILSKNNSSDTIDNFIGSSLLSMGIYSILGILTWTMGLKGLKPVALGTLLILLISIVIKHYLNLSKSRNTRGEIFCSSKNSLCDLFCFVLYIAVGVITMSYLFLGSLNDLSSIVQFDDNVTHISLVKSMLNGGSLSLISNSIYSDGPIDTAPYGLAFYPNGWHVLVALSTRISAASIPVAENAANFILGGVVFPLGVFYFLKKAFNNCKQAIPYGAFACFCCYAFPLRMLMVHGAFPNYAAFCLLPTACGIFIRLFDADNRHFNKQLLPHLILSCVGLTALHPNAIFSAIVLLTPYVFTRYIPVKMSNHMRDTTYRKKIAVTSILFLTVVIFFWVFCFFSPLFKDTVTFDWAWSSTITESLFQLLSLSFLLPNRANYFLGVIFCISLISTLTNKQTRWLIVSFVCTSILYISGGCASYFIKHLLCGFWYTDPERIQALVTISAIPILTYGIYSIVINVSTTLVKLENARFNLYLPVAIAIVAIFLTGVFGDEAKFASPTGITAIDETTYGLNLETDNTEISEYSKEEEAFMSQASGKIAKGYTVINLPSDGSALTYAINGINVYYRNYALGTNRSKGSDSKTSQIIRTTLNKYTNSLKTKKALKQINAKYVLLLDIGKRNPRYERDGRIIEQSGNSYYCKQSWRGLNINNNTPGFKLISKQGKFRLYEITEL